MASRPAVSARSERLYSRSFVTLCLFWIVALGSFQLTLAVLPMYVTGVGGSASDVGIVVGIYTIASVLLRPFIGRELDSRGKKKFMVGGTALYAVTTVLYLAAPAIPVPALVLLRFMQGCGVATLHTAAMAMVSDIAPIRRRGEAMGTLGMAGNVASGAGPALGIVIVAGMGFPTLFAIAAGIGGAALLLTTLVNVKESEHQRLPSRRGQVFSRAAAYPATLTLLSSVGYGVVIPFVPLYATQRGIDNPGLFFTVYAGMVMLVRLMTGRVSDRYGRLVVIVPSLAVAALALVLMLLVNSLVTFLLVSALFALSYGSLTPVLQAYVADRVRPEERGAGMATASAALDLGIAIGSIGLGVVLQIAGFNALYLTGAGFLVAALGLTFVQTRRHARLARVGVG